MTSLTQNTDSDGLLQLSLRMFTLNTPLENQVLFTILRKLLNNVLSNPKESKYRTIKISNKTIQQKIVAMQGGVEFLRSMHFKRATQQREQILRMQDGDVNTSWLELGLETLDSVAKSPSFSVTSSSTSTSSSSIIAACTLHIVLPTGHTLRAGFMLDETIDNVYEFVNYCRTDGNRQNGEESFVLSTAYPPCLNYVGKLRQQTIREAGLAPRSKLLIQKSKRQDAPGVFQDKPEDKTAREEAERLEIERRDLQELRVIEKKKLEREAVKLERERAVQSFKDDRKEVDRRGEFELKKAARLDYESGWRQRMGTDNTVEKNEDSVERSNVMEMEGEDDGTAKGGGDQVDDSK